MVVLWDPATRTRAATLTGHTELTGHTDLNLWFATSPAGSRLISSDWDFRDPAHGCGMRARAGSSGSWPDTPISSMQGDRIQP